MKDDLVYSKEKTEICQRVLRGVYAEGNNYSLLSAYLMRFPQAIVTLHSALSVYGMTDYPVEPPFVLAFPRGSRILHDGKVKQHFPSFEYFALGECQVVYEGRPIRIYDRERLLIEVFHNRRKMGDEHYKAAIASFRQIVRTGLFSVPKFQGYCQKISYAKSDMSRLFLEVM
jgi:hypothetical protein